MIDTTALVNAITPLSSAIDSLIQLFVMNGDALKAELANDPAAQAIIDAQTAALVAKAAEIQTALQSNVTP